MERGTELEGDGTAEHHDRRSFEMEKGEFEET